MGSAPLRRSVTLAYGSSPAPAELVRLDHPITAVFRAGPPLVLGVVWTALAASLSGAWFAGRSTAAQR